MPEQGRLRAYGQSRISQAVEGNSLTVIPGSRLAILMKVQLIVFGDCKALSSLHGRRTLEGSYMTVADLDAEASKSKSHAKTPHVCAPTCQVPIFLEFLRYLAMRASRKIITKSIASWDTEMKPFARFGYSETWG